MPDPKKNPLLGAFRASPKEDKPPAEPPKEDKAAAMVEQAKEAETPKPSEQAKASTGEKSPAAPDKPSEEKKPAEPPKTAEQAKTPVGAMPLATPEKPGEVKKAVEPPKTAEQAKAPAGDKPLAASGKPGEEKKTTEPPKPAGGQKPADQGKDGKGVKEVDPSKAGEEKKAPEVKVSGSGKVVEIPIEKPGEEKTAELPKAAEQAKAPAKDKSPAAPSKPAEEKKPAEQPKAAEQTKPAEELDEDGIPKDFSMEIVPQDDLGKVTKLAVSYIDDFEGHPFPVRDDADMDALVKSIKQVGILEAATVIPNPKKRGRFEMVAGHRRMHAAKLAGLTEIPVIIRNMDHDEATVYMVDSNLKREIPLTPMEKARAYTMRAEALKRKTGRRSKAETAALEASGKKPLTADEEIAQQTGESVAQVQRLKTLTKLTPELQQMVDSKKLPVNTAVDIAQMKPKEQEALADAIAKEDKVPSGTKAKELKEASKAGTLTTEKIAASVAPTKREESPPLKLTLTEEELRPYFPDKRTTIPDAKRGVLEALNLWKKAMEKKKAQSQAQSEKDPKKKSTPAR